MQYKYSRKKPGFILIINYNLSIRNIFNKEKLIKPFVMSNNTYNFSNSSEMNIDNYNRTHIIYGSIDGCGANITLNNGTNYLVVTRSSDASLVMINVSIMLCFIFLFKLYYNLKVQINTIADLLIIECIQICWFYKACFSVSNPMGQICIFALLHIPNIIFIFYRCYDLIKGHLKNHRNHVTQSIV